MAAAMKMERKNTSGKFDYYAITWRLEKEMFRYSFQIFGKDEVLHYNQCGVSEEENEAYAFEIMPGFYTPELGKMGR